MKSNEELVEEYIKNGGTEHELVEKIQLASGKSCLLCKKYPVQYVGVSMSKDKKLITYTLCPCCTAKLQKNEKKVMKLIEAKLMKREEKAKLDTKYDFNEAM